MHAIPLFFSGEDSDRTNKFAILCRVRLNSEARAEKRKSKTESKRGARQDRLPLNMNEDSGTPIKAQDSREDAGPKPSQVPRSGGEQPLR